MYKLTLKEIIVLEIALLATLFFLVDGKEIVVYINVCKGFKIGHGIFFLSGKSIKIRQWEY